MNVRDMGNIYSMLHFCDAIERKLGRFGIDEDTWYQDPDMRDVIYVSIEQIGERASKVSDMGRSELPKVQWQKIIGLRNVVNYPALGQMMAATEAGRMEPLEDQRNRVVNTCGGSREDVRPSHGHEDR